MTQVFRDFNGTFNYVFLDESGNSSISIWDKIEADIKEHGFLSREFSTFTISGIFIKSKSQYNFLAKDLKKLKKDLLNIDSSVFVHRTDLKNNIFLQKHKISDKFATWQFETNLLGLISKHKIPIFSASFNRELIYQKPNFNFNFYKNKFSITKVCVEKIMKNLFLFLFKKYKNQNIKKTILVFEITDKKKENLIEKTYKDILIKKPIYKKYFEELMFCSKLDKNKQPIVGNELIDFINYASWLWASNFYYQKTKIQFPNYPSHLKKSISIIDADIYKEESDIIN